MTPLIARPARRNDIDSLRALAIVAVVIYHIFPAVLPGGFMGVDVFFVISGFLITGHIHRDVLAGRFSFIGFYERRLRRLMPALVVMLVACSAAAVLLLSPVTLRTYASNLQATTLFIANLRLAKETNYFHVDVRENPLLHMWSLGVEEQFYLIVPLVMLVLMAVLKLGRQAMLASLSLVVLGSLALAQWKVAHVQQQQAFYLLQYRAWELGIGALLAVALATPGAWLSRLVQPSLIRGGMVLLGLVMIGLPLMCFNRSMLFPGLLALPACLGSALIILAGSGATTGPRAGVGSVIPWLGRISYSWYLWHWPVIVYIEYVVIRPLTMFEGVVVLFVTLVVGAMSHHLVEQPFITRRWLPSPTAMLVTPIVLLVMLCGGGKLVEQSDGLSARFPQRVSVLTTVSDRSSNYWASSSPTPPWPRLAQDPGIRVVGKTDDAASGSSPSFVVWGDSHLVALAPALDEAARMQGVSGIMITKGGSAPLFDCDLPATSESRGLYYRDYTASVLEQLVHRPASVTDVILCARWRLYADQVTFSGDGRQAGFAAGFLHTVAAIRTLGCHVWLIDQAPEPGFHVPSALSRATMFNRPLPPMLSHDVYDAQSDQAAISAVFKQAQQQSDVRIVSIADLLWQDRMLTITSASGTPLYRDTNHLQNAGAAQIRPALDALMRDVRRP